MRGFFLIVPWLLFISQISGTALRTLTNSQGLEIKVDVLAVDDKSVTFKRISDGEKFTLPFNRLSPSDREYFKEAVNNFTNRGEPVEKLQKGAAIVASVTGTVMVIDPPKTDSNSSIKEGEAKKRIAKVNDVLAPKSQVYTGKRSETILLFTNGNVATVGADTQVRIEAFGQEEFDGTETKVADLDQEVSNSGMKLDLELGELVLGVRKLDKESSFVISSPVGSTAIRGTQLRVTTKGDATTVSVLTGLVDFLDTQKIVRPLGRETRLEVENKRFLRRVDLPISDRSRILDASREALQKTGLFSLAQLSQAFDEVNARGVAIPPRDDGPLNEALSKALGEVDDEKLAGATRLSLFSSNIIDISKLANAKKLSFLNLAENKIANISALENLTEMRELKLTKNQVTDINPLAQLIELTHLHLGENRITKVGSLVALTKLTELYLQDNQVTDISAVAKMTNLSWLWLSRNSIKDISPLSKLSKLTKLALDENEIINVTPLASLTDLTELHLKDNQITDPTPLASLVSLRKLDLSGNKIPNSQKEC